MRKSPKFMYSEYESQLNYDNTGNVIYKMQSSAYSR